MNHSEYSCSKLASPEYFETVEKLASSEFSTRALTVTPLTIHLFLQNICNHSCAFCSFRLPQNKNSEAFNEGAHIPWDRMQELLEDFDEMNVRGIEVTGGGEPLAYPYTEQVWEEFASYDFATALVTNGTLMKDRAPLICAGNLRWARVSIDALDRDTYSRMRKCPPGHFDLAWRAVRELRDNQPKRADFRLGVGFVLCNENAGQVYEFVKRAKDSGADNVRLTVTYSDQHETFFKDRTSVDESIFQARKAKEDFEDASFSVHNLMVERWRDVVNHHQDYDRCITQEVLCVVEGEGRVYTCCTFTGSNKGMQGIFWEHPGGFKGLWTEKASWRRKLNPRTYCTNSCLYEKRNLEMLKIVESARAPKQIHTEFI